MEIDQREGVRLREALRREEERADDRVMLLMVLMVMGAFLAGYGLNAWASSRAVSAYHGALRTGLSRMVTSIAT
jgi:hypothetical protein